MDQSTITYGEHKVDSPLLSVSERGAAYTPLTKAILDALGAGIGPFGYRLKGTDTWTWEDQGCWLGIKAIIGRLSLYGRYPEERFVEIQAGYARLLDLGQRLCARHRLPAGDEDDMGRLVIAAEAGDEDTFLRAIHGIDWSQRPASDFIRAVKLALAAGAHLAARKLARQGAYQHPEDSELETMARVLAPPRVIRADLPPTPNVAANQAWLRAHAEEYQGQWVALRDGRLLAAAPTAVELGANVTNTEGVMVTRVY
jgi:hypothetical protein